MMMKTRMQWTFAAMLTVGVPGLVAAQGTPVPDSAKQGTATGRTVSPRNESGDSSKSALRDSVIRNSTNTNTAPTQSGASTTGGSASANAREGAATGGAGAMRQTLDSAQSMQAAETGRPVPRANESGDTTKSALRDQLLRESVSASGAASGSARGARGSMRLSRAQTQQLQEALNGAGCDAGSADGVMGRKTRSAIACARQQKGIAANDNQALYKALGLSF